MTPTPEREAQTNPLPSDLRPAEHRLTDLLDGADVSRLDMDTVRVEMEVEHAHSLADEIERVRAVTAHADLQAQLAAVTAERDSLTIQLKDMAEAFDTASNEAGVARAQVTCVVCRHAAHGKWCPNMASDGDCNCTHVTESGAEAGRG